MTKKALGKGLGALLSDIDDNNSIKEINIIDVEPNQYQPRKQFNDNKIRELADSIKVHGVIQPIIVKQQESGFYEIIAGERRWRAAKIAGLKVIPAIIKDYNKKEIMEIALIENLQREDLNPIEESQAFKNLIEEFKLTQDEISKRVGKSRSAIANSLRLLNLDDELKKLVIEGKISSGHARAILSLQDIKLQKEVANKIIKYNLSVRETEKYVKKLLNEKNKKSVNKERVLNPEIIDIQNKLAQSLGTKVKIHCGKKKGKIEIEYYSDEDLERLMNFLTH